MFTASSRGLGAALREPDEASDPAPLNPDCRFVQLSTLPMSYREQQLKEVFKVFDLDGGGFVEVCFLTNAADR